VRNLQFGDKIASHHAQKNTVGLTLNQTDMPFDPVDGLTPDIIVNSHAIPSRMTLAQILEMITGEVACKNGKIYDATPFLVPSQKLSKTQVEDTVNTKSQTYKRFYWRNYGEVLVTLLCSNMVDDKLHSRALLGKFSC
jgi:DNA-directed RNA polymerase beta subunit